MIELLAADFALANPLVEKIGAGSPIAGAVLSGHTKGKIFLGPQANTRIGFVYNNGFCVLGGAIADAQFASACLNWLYRHAEQDFFILYPGHAGWVPILDALVTPPVRKIERIAFQLDAQIFAAQEVSIRPLSNEFNLARMDAALMRTLADTVYPWADGTWKSEMQFEREGLGYCVLTQGRVVSLCYSIFVSGLHREIDILTVDSYKRQGLARAAASAFIRDCLNQGLQPGWDCFKENRASLLLAEGLGFVQKNSFPVYSWHRVTKPGNET